jgi:extradiol dioxygenase family protein
MTSLEQKTKPAILEAAFIGYPVVDMARARHFYETVLGLTCTHISEDGNWIEYDLKNTTLVIGRSEGGIPPPVGHP